MPAPPVPSSPANGVSGLHVVVPERGESDLRIVGSKGHINGAGVVVLVEHLAPGLAAVGGLEDAALLVGREGMAQRSDEDDVGILRIDPDRGDVARVFQPDVLPGLAGVGRLPHAVALIDRSAHVADIAGSDVDDVRIRRRNGDRADRGDVLLVEDGLPHHAAVGGLPRAAARGSHVVDRRLAGNTGHAVTRPARNGPICRHCIPE